MTGVVNADPYSEQHACKHLFRTRFLVGIKRLLLRMSELRKRDAFPGAVNLKHLV